jgi:type VI protein secretion system component Hcp
MANEILMMLMNGTAAVAADCQVEIDTTDTFMSGFTAGHFFEVKDFDFSVRLVDNDTVRDDRSEKSKDKDKDKDKEKNKKGNFSRWMQGADMSGYEPEMETVSVTRMADKASPLLFQNCFRAKSYDKAVVIKRRVGLGRTGTNSGVQSFPYFRVDFTDVLLVSVDWDAEETGIKEKLKFVPRYVKVQYRPQNQDGSKGTVVPGSGGWLSLVKTG